MPDLDQLRSLGDQIVPPPLDSLRETARRRTRLTTAGIAIATAVVTVGVVTAALNGFSSDDNASPSPVGPPEEDTTRPLTYAEGATLHLGDATVTLPAPVEEIDLTDAGAIVRTEDGTIWFTDGGSQDEIGTLGTPADAYATGELPLFTPSGWVVSGNAGALAAWFEFPTPTDPVLVVYDTATGEPLVDREPITVRGDTWELPASLTDAAVFWFVDPGTDSEVPSGRFDLATGKQTRISRDQYAAALPADGTPRTLTNNGDGTWPFTVMDGTHQQFGVDGGKLKPVGGGDFQVWDGPTESRLAFDAPDGYRNALVFLTQWIDDDTVALRADAPKGFDLLVCRISTQSCEVGASGPSSMVVPDLG